MSSPLNSVQIFTQDTPSTTWTINHTMPAPVVTEVIVSSNGTLQKMLPLSVVQVSATQVQITFTEALAGFARLAGARETTAVVGPGTVDLGQQ